MLQHLLEKESASVKSRTSPPKCVTTALHPDVTMTGFLAHRPGDRPLQANRHVNHSSRVFVILQKFGLVVVSPDMHLESYLDRSVYPTFFMG